MKDSELLNFFDIHKNGKVLIEHFWNETEGTKSITLAQFFRMFELAHERKRNAVTQD